MKTRVLLSSIFFMADSVVSGYFRICAQGQHGEGRAGRCELWVERYTTEHRVPRLLGAAKLPPAESQSHVIKLDATTAHIGPSTDHRQQAGASKHRTTRGSSHGFPNRCSSFPDQSAVRDRTGAQSYFPSHLPQQCTMHVLGGSRRFPSHSPPPPRYASPDARPAHPLLQTHAPAPASLSTQGICKP